MSLRAYKQKRNFSRTPEPKGKVEKNSKKPLYVVQKHAASHLHYDFRLELDGVLKSWAVPKGPSLDPKEKRLAVQVEDHPIAYGSFEGVIPQGEYGAGTVMLWDKGWWQTLGDASADYAAGKLEFILHGEKLQGKWLLLRVHFGKGKANKNWLLIKEKDSAASKDKNDDAAVSIVSGRTMQEIADADVN